MCASQQISGPLDISGVLFEAIRGWVSHKALRKVLEQWQLLLMPLKAAYTSTFTSLYRLLCVHTLKRLEDEGRALLLEHFHPHWHLKQDRSQPQPILKPGIVPSQLNLTGNKRIMSTRREPSVFEVIEVVIRPKAETKYSRYHTVGYIMTSRVCPL